MRCSGKGWNDLRELMVPVAGGPGLLEILMRLLCAMAVGLVIGTEREYTNRPAGMRTHILVALGSCAVMVTGELLFVQYSALGAMPDPARLGAQVITGVGFLGAGTILREGTNVKGLTTAASLWAVACLGLAAGAGYYGVALLGMVFIFITLTIFEVIQNKLIGHDADLVYYSVVTSDLPVCLNTVSQISRKCRAGIHDITTQRREEAFVLCFRVEIGGMRAKRRRGNFLEKLASAAEIESVRADSEEKVSF